jgi:type I restriction enzyme R subunit
MAATYQSELQLEDQLIRKLQALGYQKVTIPDADTLYAHFRKLLNQRNAAKLKGTPLSDREFNAVLNDMMGSKTHYQIAHLLRKSDAGVSGTIQIQRDDDSVLYLNIFDSGDAANNIYEVTHQLTVEGRHQNRYDVILLVNGLPLAQIELKRRGVDFSQAFNQIIRYRNESLPFVKLFKFTQLFIISNGNETRYFANGDGQLNSNFMFYWTDRENHWLNDLDAFAASFLNQARFHSLIAKYTVFDSSTQKMLIMRPYQIYAVEAIMQHAQQHPDQNGYIWHTTGSGKTITSFKASRLLTEAGAADKVIFLIDRSDLDIQTAKNFNAYMPETSSGKAALDRTDDTSILVKQLSSTDNPLIITTIQKLNNAINSPRYKDLLDSYHDRRVIFIEDEAHRSQFGEMRKNVNHWFKNAQHFGFTGTPIFGENVGKDGRTTADLYDVLLHQYLIKDAIRDGNVLGFSVQYINTIQGKGFQNDDEQVRGIDKQEVFSSPQRLALIAGHILRNHTRISKKRHYNAILTVPDTRTALAYYDIFKKLNAELAPEQRQKVTTIFTWAANEVDNEDHQKQDDVTSRQGLDQVATDYNTMYHTDFSTDQFKDFFADVSKRMKDHNDQTPSENIDILIVVNMFLTGFDSKRLSTLYVDRKLQWHTLIQAFSRTNRIESKQKPFGNIVAYRNIKKKTDDAVKLYSAGSTKAFFAPTYQELKDQFEAAIATLKTLTPTVQDVDQLYNQGDEALKEFVEDFRALMRVHNKIRVYDDFEWDQFEGEFTNQDLEDFQGKYYTAYDHLKAEPDGEVGSVLDDIDFEIELLQTDTINVQYIVGLIKAINLDSAENRKADVDKIRRLLTNADNDQLKSKVDLLTKFLDEEVPHLQKGADLGNALNAFMEESRKAAIEGFSKSNALPEDFVNEQIDEYNFYGHANDREIMDQLSENGLKFKQKREVKQLITAFVAEAISDYTLE